MSNFNSSIYFGTPVWTNNVPEFVQPMNKVCDKYIKNAKKNLLPVGSCLNVGIKLIHNINSGEPSQLT